MERWWKVLDSACLLVGTLVGAAVLYYTAGIYYGWDKLIHSDPPVSASSPSSEVAMMSAPWWLYALGVVAALLLITGWAMLIIRWRSNRPAPAPAIVPVFNRTITGERVVIDNHIYNQCIFVNCTFIYEGGFHSIINCQAQGTRGWETHNATVTSTIDILRVLQMLEPSFAASWRLLPPAQT